MSLNTERLMRLLEQYRDRLHNVGDDEHDEELDYVKQILTSPVFLDYLQGQSSQEDTSKISEFSNEVLSGIEGNTVSEDGPISPTEKQRRKLARKQSLKALRNAVTPHNSPMLKKKAVRPGNASTDTLDNGSVPGRTRAGPHGGSGSINAKSGSRTRNEISPPKLLDSVTPNVHSHHTGGELRANINLSNGLEPPTNSLDARIRNLSNSTNTLIERPSPPGDHYLEKKKPSDVPLLQNGIMSGSHPEIHRVGLGSQHGPKTGHRRLDLDMYGYHPPAIANPGPNPGPNSSLFGPEWSHQSQHPPYRDHIERDLGLNLHQPANPLDSHVVQPQQSQPPPYIPSLDLPQNQPPIRPPPPPYGQQLAPQRKATSFEKLLDRPDVIPIQLPPPPPPMKPLLHPMTDGSVTQDLPTTQNRGRDRMTLVLEKGEEGLGFRVKGEGGVFVLDLQPGGLAERDGRLKRNDQIVSINGQSLEGLPHNEAVKLLQLARGRVDLVILRDQYPAPPPNLHSPSVTKKPPTLAQSYQQQQQLQPPTAHIHNQHTLPPSQSQEQASPGQDHQPTTREQTIPSPPHQQKIETLELPNEGHGFGFGVIPGSHSGTVIHSIMPGGIADNDGRLQQGDQLLQINEESVIHMRYDDVVAQLRSVSQAGKPIRLVVARPVKGEDPGAIPELNDSSDEEVEEFEVELHKQNRGLGITIAGLVKTDTGEEVSGIYITSLNPNGAAAKDGRIQVQDRIVKVDGHFLRGLENMEAAAVLRNSGNPIKLVLGRRKRREATSPPTASSRSQATPEPPTATVIDTQDQPHDQSPGQSHDQSPKQSHDQSLDQPAESHDQTLVQPKDSHGSESPPQVTVEDFERPGAAEAIKVTALSNEETEEEALVQKWSNILGSEYIVKVDQVTKDSPQGGLGIRMESTVELDDAGNPQVGSIHHVIQYVHGDGPVGQHGILQEGDEILEVNDTVLVGLKHDEAIEVVKDTPTSVRIVVCHLAPSAEEQGSETAPTSESEDDKCRNSTPDTDSIPSLPSIDYSVLGDFTRRFERQSWRERHEEERRRLKQRFEQRREEHERHIREQEEELLQQELELQERQQRQAKEEQQRKADAEQKRSSTLFQPEEFDYTFHHGGQPNFIFPMQIHSPDSNRDSFCTDSSTGLLSPVPGSGLWESEITEIELPKGDKGLGFSILDFADPLHPADRVILVHSLVEGCVAETDGRLRVGDRLVSVGHTSVVNHSLQFAVQQLVKIPKGCMVKIGVNHPLPASPEINSSPGSSLLGSDPFGQFFAESLSTVEQNEQIVQNGATLHFEDLDEKPLSDTIEPEPPCEAEDRDEVGREEEDSAHWKKKTALESEDDEPPPPYTKIDPQEAKFDKVGGAEPQEPPEQAAVEKKLAPEGASPTASNSSTVSASRITSPRGRTLSDLTRITPEDEARLLGSRENILESISKEEQVTDTMQLEYLSESTLVNSGSQSEASQTATTTNSAVVKLDQPKLVLDRTGSPLARRREAKKEGRKPNGGQSLQQELEKQAVNLTVGYGQGTIDSSQESCGLSPEMSDYGDHSTEVDTEPREIKIRKGSSSLGMSLTSEDKTGFISVKNVSSSGAVGKDGRIRIGDRIVAVNRKTLEGISLPKAKAILKRASSKTEEISITYIPAPQLHAHVGYMMPPYAKLVGKSTSTHALRASSHPPSVSLLQSHHPMSMGVPLHNIVEHEPPQGTMLGAQANIQMSPHTVMHPGSLNPQPMPQMMHHGQATPNPPWQQGVSPYVPSGASPMGPLPGMPMQGGYMEQPSALGKPPPPYGYSHQPPGMMAQNPGVPYPQPQPQPQPMSWGMQQQPSGPGPMHVSPPQSQPTHPMSWMGPGPGVMHRNPPQYSDLMAHHSQQMLQGPQYPPMPGMDVHQQHHQQQQPLQSPRMNKSQSENKFPSGMASRPHIERRHTHEIPRKPYHIPDRPLRNRSKQRSYDHHSQLPKQYTLESYNSSEQHAWSHDSPFKAVPEANRLQEAEMVRTRYVELIRDPSGSLGVHIGQLGEEGTPSGVYVRSLSKNCQAVTRGRLSRGDHILEVNGIDLRRATQAEAINVITNANSPVRLLVQISSERKRPSKLPRSKAIQESPEHSHHNSWAIEEDEDPALREEFPEIEGHLFEVQLHKGKAGLGLSIVGNTNSPSAKGIVIMGVQAGGVADQSGQIKWGDIILKVNDTCVIGMSQQQVQELLAKAPPLVRFVLVRQHMNMGGAHPKQTQQPASLAAGDKHGGTHLKQPSFQQQRDRHGGTHSKQSSFQQQPPSLSTGDRPGDSMDVSLIGLSQVKAISLGRDDEKGLGFTVAEGEQRDNSVVVVTSISDGGPAQQDGQLQVGDQILSVDGQQILGYSYEKARHLLQQARARGSVSLMVASRAALQEGGGIEGVTLPEGVVLRKKKPRGSSLKTSRRRPVSVDRDFNIQMGTVKSREDEVPQEGNRDRYSHHSNRSSHPLTDREVEEGFQQLERHKVFVPGKECEIVIFKGSQILGLAIVGGTDSYLGGIYVQKVLPDSPAARDGRLQPGDKILKVNNASLESATREDALQVLQHPAPFVHLTVLRDPAQGANITLSEDRSPKSEIETIELIKPERGGLGLIITEKEDHPGVYVQEVVENEAAYMDGRIRAGDKILAINGQDMSNASQDFVVRTLQGCRSKVSFTVCHPSHSPPPQSQLDYGMTPPEREEHQAFSRPPPEYPFSSPSGSIRVPGRSPPPYSSGNALPASPTQASRPLQQYGDFVPPPHHQGGTYRGERRPPSPPGGYRGERRLPSPQGGFRGERRPPSPQGGYRGERRHPSPQGSFRGERRPPSSPGGYRGERRPPSPPPSLPENEKIKVIRLHRGPSGLGFTIVGGKASAHGDLPIIIKRVYDEGAAGRDGRLKKGDKVLSVNGISFEGVTHQYAAERLKYLQGDVELTVLSTE